MYTQCPACKTVFRLHPEQLNAAHGQVRCSRCQTIFNALENLFQEGGTAEPSPPAAQTPPTDNSDQPESTTATSRESVAADMAREAEEPLLETQTGLTEDSWLDEFPESGAQETAVDEIEQASGTGETVEGETDEPLVETQAGLTEDSWLDEFPENGAQETAVDEIEQASVTGEVEEGETEEPLVETQASLTEDSWLHEFPETGAQEAVNEIEPVSTAGDTGETEEPLFEAQATPTEEEWLHEFSETGAQGPVGETEQAWPLKEETPPSVEAPQAPSGTETTTASEEFAEQEPPVQAKPAAEEAPAELAVEQSPPQEQSELENLPLFANEADESTEDLLQPDEAAQSPEIMPSAEDFDEELLSLFDADESAPPPKAMEKADSEARTTHSLDEEILTPAPEELEPISTEEPLAETEKAGESPAWSHFSEENIEALLSAGEEQEPLNDGGVFERKNEQHPFAGVDELDLATGTEPETEEDQTLLNQRLPEEQEVDELDLEKLELTSENRGAEPTEPPNESPSQAAERPSYSLPLEQQTARGGLLGTLFWGSGIILMLAALALQYLYYQRQALAENPQLRPLLAQMCEFTGCQLPPRRDLSKIELGNHLVQFHPRYENSLLITATLINRADFSQPFPIVEVVMTDLQQKVIARRRFLPKQYLVGSSETQVFSPGIEVPLMLEVVDPGKNAVGFEFNFY